MRADVIRVCAGVLADYTGIGHARVDEISPAQQVVHGMSQLLADVEVTLTNLNRSSLPHMHSY